MHPDVCNPLRRLRRALLGLAAALVAPTLLAAPEVVVSIKPLHSLTAQVMRGVGEPGLLLAGAASPHTHTLRPSQRRALAQADLVVWVGPTLESFLDRTLRAERLGRADAEAPWLLTLLDLDDMRLLPLRAGGHFPLRPEDHPAAEHEHEHEHEHDKSARGIPDPHLWLSPHNAGVAVTAIATRLSRLDPAHADVYAANAASAIARIRRTREALAARFTAIQGRPYVVLHDAYQYLEAAFGLTAMRAIHQAPGRPGGARSRSEIRAQLRSGVARCVFYEPQFDPAVVRTLVEGTGARLGQLDPLGLAVPPGPAAWSLTMSALADALTGCLGDGREGATPTDPSKG